MSDELLWKYDEIKNYISAVLQYKFLHRPVRWKHWAGKKILNPEESNQEIFDAIIRGKGYMACRSANQEMSAVLYYIRKALNVDPGDLNEIGKGLSVNAGMFSNDSKGIQIFADRYLESICQADLYAIWCKETEEFIMRKYVKKAQPTLLGYLEPYYSSSIYWTSALEGKRVLVVSPFTDTIKKQYQYRKLIWPEREVLPEFSLITVKAVQTSCGACDARFSTWFEAFNFMLLEIKKQNFDVAILGCGSYAVPLAKEIKEMGKVAIALGGATQVLFGIIGKRWEERPFFKAMMNEYWVRPSEEEKPKNANQVEGGCYW